MIRLALSERLRRGAGSALTIILTACGGPADDAESGNGGTVQGAGETVRYSREFVFLSQGGGDATIVPFVFRAHEVGDTIDRTAIAWLGRGATWDRFLESNHAGTPTGGVWRVAPHTDLRVLAGGPVEVESFRFERDERRLRLDLAGPVTPWTEAGDTRFRLLTGRLFLGTETLTGPVLEVLDIERMLADGWPPSQDFDAIFLTSGDSVQIVLAESIGDSSRDDRGYAWFRTPSAEGTADGAEIRWLDVRPLQDARRDIPRRWSFRIPGQGIIGEVDAVGQDVLLGPERGGRRAIEIRFGVEGWIQIGEVRRPVIGMVRHLQQ